MAVQEKTLTCGQLEWFYRVVEAEASSTRVPVVLLHGLPATGHSWRGVLLALEERGFGAIAPDWIGFGASAKPDRRTFAYTPDAYITALEDFLAALGIQRCSLIVQGFIGAIGLQYALRHPDQIERLVVLNAPLTSRAKLPWKMKQLGLPLAGEMLTQDPLLVDRTLESGGGYVIKDADLDIYRRPFLKSSDAGRALFAVVQNLRLAQTTAEIQQGFPEWPRPVLVAWGLRDRWLPVDLATEFVQVSPEAELVQLPDVGHYPQIDWFDKVNEVVIPFLLRSVI
ncbi:MAG: alpha/beta fold hydrolase [Cyanobacteria bacterium J069]